MSPLHLRCTSPCTSPAPLPASPPASPQVLLRADKADLERPKAKRRSSAGAKSKRMSLEARLAVSSDAIEDRDWSHSELDEEVAARTEAQQVPHSLMSSSTPISSLSRWPTFTEELMTSFTLINSLTH